MEEDVQLVAGSHPLKFIFPEGKALLPCQLAAKLPLSLKQQVHKAQEDPLTVGLPQLFVIIDVEGRITENGSVVGQCPAAAGHGPQHERMAVDRLHIPHCSPADMGYGVLRRKTL